ncbi:MAG TPA: PIG-L deacetylase family protein [Acidimicrobiales bacterium]|nr:PIG-L deacetylase family protein [Acidimicrobiales bacterium]
MKLLVTVAHPDDEAFGCGSLLARARAAGVETVVACATRGELGEVAPGLCHVPPGPELLGRIREAELRHATALLGVSRVDVLGWRDSGVDGEPAPGSLCAATPQEVEAAIGRILDEERPDVVVTLDAGDGHRDHAVVCDATLAATAGRPSAVYLWCLPRSLMQAFTGLDELGTPDADITHQLDASDVLDLRWEAMRAHRSQVPPYDAMAPELQRAFLATDHLREVRAGAVAWI